MVHLKITFYFLNVQFGKTEIAVFVGTKLLLFTLMKALLCSAIQMCSNSHLRCCRFCLEESSWLSHVFYLFIQSLKLCCLCGISISYSSKVDFELSLIYKWKSFSLGGSDLRCFCVKTRAYRQSTIQFGEILFIILFWILYWNPRNTH